MTAEIVERVQIRCDGCRGLFEYYDEGVALFASAEQFVEQIADAHGWTTDGEGLHHCEDCAPLELTQDAKDEIARRPGPNDVPLEGLE